MSKTKSYFSRVPAPKGFPAIEATLRGTPHSDPTKPEDFSKVRYTPMPVGETPNIALLWTRYAPAHASFERSFQDWKCVHLPGSTSADHEAASKSWSGSGALNHFKAVARGIRVDPELERLHERRERSLQLLGNYGEIQVKANWRSAIGLGNPSTFENSGVTLHQTYGFPVLPASSLKGIARHFINEGFESLPEGAAARQAAGAALPPGVQLAERLFGSNAAEDDDHLAVIRIHDGWPLHRAKQDWFDVDVLTVHHKKYYEDSKDFKFAKDSESPVPVHFLTLKPGVEFKIPIGLTSYGRVQPDAIPGLAYTCELLRSALRWWGVGAKTATGFGRMIPS